VPETVHSNHHHDAFDSTLLLLLMQRWECRYRDIPNLVGCQTMMCFFHLLIKASLNSRKVLGLSLPKPHLHLLEELWVIGFERQNIVCLLGKMRAAMSI
jgi:hypothetical protein